MESTDTTTSASGTGGDQAQGKGGMIDRVKERAAAQLSNQKEKATDGLGSVAAMVRQGTQQLRDQRHDTIAGYVDQAADQIEKFSRQLRDKDVGELLDDAQRLARRRPAVFIGSAFALGVIGARFFKSSSEHDRRHAGKMPGGSSTTAAACTAVPVQRAATIQPFRASASTRRHSTTRPSHASAHRVLRSAPM